MAPRPAPGHSVKLSTRLYAEAAILAELKGRTVGQYVETVLAQALERDRHALRIDQFGAAKHEALVRRRPEPLPQDFGLPHTYR